MQSSELLGGFGALSLRTPPAALDSRCLWWLGSVPEVPHLEPAPEAPAPTHTALIAPVPAAEPLVAEHRRRLDAAAGWGVPAHVTVLYPFIDPSEVDEQVIAVVGEAVATVPAFDCSFVRSRWFRQDVLWLDPEPAQPFRDLTTAVLTAFLEHPPYGGAHDDVVPHLTVAERRLADLPAVRAAEHAVQPGLPVTTRIDRVLFITGAQAPNSWSVLHQFTLASTGGSAHRHVAE